MDRRGGRNFLFNVTMVFREQWSYKSKLGGVHGMNLELKPTFCGLCGTIGECQTL